MERSGDGRAQHRAQVRALPVLSRAGGVRGGCTVQCNAGLTVQTDGTAMVTVDGDARRGVCVNRSGMDRMLLDFNVTCRVSVAFGQSGQMHWVVNCLGCCAVCGGRDSAHSGLIPRPLNGHGHDRTQAHFEHHQPDQQPRARTHEAILSVAATGKCADIQKAPRGFHLAGLWDDSQGRSPAREEASKTTVVVQQHLTAEHQKVVQMEGQDVESDGQLQTLIVVDRYIAKADHAFHLFRCGRR